MSFTVREIYEAGKKVLGITAETAQESAAEAAAETVELKSGETASTPTLAEQIAASLDARQYRVTFKNGCGMNVDGLALKHNFCLDAAQIESIEPE